MREALSSRDLPLLRHAMPSVTRHALSACLSLAARNVSVGGKGIAARANVSRAEHRE